MGLVRIGTCSWTDKTMVKAWYPSGTSSAEARLRYYAERFDTVEADSTFYALPQRRITQLWAERTPPGFIFHVKAYGMMTQHHVDERTLVPELRDFPYELTKYGRVKNPHPDMVDAAFDMFLDALDPLREAGKLGGVLMQFPAFFTAKDPGLAARNLEYIDSVRERLAGYHVLVEFRHSSWVVGDQLERTLEFLTDRGLSYVSVDAPQFQDGTTMPPVAAATGPWGYVRFHGRNKEMYYKQTQSAADRFDYLYTDDELREWDDRVRAVAEAGEQTFVMFNNCRSDYAPRNAAQMAAILHDIVAPRPGAPAPSAGGPLPGRPLAATDDDAPTLF